MAILKYRIIRSNWLNHKFVEVVLLFWPDLCKIFIQCSLIYTSAPCLFFLQIGFWLVKIQSTYNIII